MKRRALAVCLALAMTVGMMAGCGSKDASKSNSSSGSEAKVYNMAVAAFPDTLNPTANVDVNMAITQALFDCLYSTDANGDTTYYLAKSCEASDDKLTYTLTLRDDATWSDGEKITADDVIFTTNYYQKYASGAFISLTQGYTCEKVDDQTVKFTLDSFESSFGKDLGSIRLLPAHIFNDDIDSVDGSEYLNSEKLVGSGAYTISEMNTGESYVLKARDDYYGGKPGMEILNMRLMSDSNSQQMAFDSGELSSIIVSTADDYKKYNTDDYNVTTFSSGQVIHLQYNPDGQSNQGLSADERSAVAKAIDRDEIVKTAYGSEDLAKPSDSMFASTQKYFDDSIKHEVDTEGAKALAESTGLKDKTLHIIYNTTLKNAEAIGVVVQQQLAEAGIKAEVQGYDPAAFYQRTFHAAMGNDKTATEATDWDYAIGSDSGMYGDASANQLTYAFMSLFGEQASGLVIGAYGTADETQREAMFKQAQQAVNANGYWISLVEENTVIVSQKNIVGYDKNMQKPVFINYSAFDVK